MTFTVEVHYGEGLPARDSRPFKDRASALNHALSLANDLGRTFSSGERGWAKWVSIRLDGKVDIAIQVIRGGLRGTPDHEGLLEF